MQKTNLYRQQIDDPSNQDYDIIDHFIDSTEALDRGIGKAVEYELDDLMVLAKVVDMVKDIKDITDPKLLLDQVVTTLELYLQRREKSTRAILYQRETDRALLESALMRDDQKH